MPNRLTLPESFVDRSPISFHLLSHIWRSSVWTLLRLLTVRSPVPVWDMTPASWLPLEKSMESVELDCKQANVYSDWINLAFKFCRASLQRGRVYRRGLKVWSVRTNHLRPLKMSFQTRMIEKIEMIRLKLEFFELLLLNTLKKISMERFYKSLFSAKTFSVRVAEVHLNVERCPSACITLELASR